MKTYVGSEKRKHPRLSANFIISYRITQVPENYDLSQTKNVSQGGILLTTNKKFEKGLCLALTIRFPFISQRISVHGEVVESKEVVRDLIYETRVKFLDLDTELFEKVGEFVKKYLK
jgi:hypothetical protein